MHKPISLFTVGSASCKEIFAGHRPLLLAFSLGYSRRNHHRVLNKDVKSPYHPFHVYDIADRSGVLKVMCTKMYSESVKTALGLHTGIVSFQLCVLRFFQLAIR